MSQPNEAQLTQKPRDHGAYGKHCQGRIDGRGVEELHGVLPESRGNPFAGYRDVPSRIASCPVKKSTAQLGAGKDWRAPWIDALGVPVRPFLAKGRLFSHLCLAQKLQACGV
jgi:hypothetical protein